MTGKRSNSYWASTPQNRKITVNSACPREAKPTYQKPIIVFNNLRTFGQDHAIKHR